VVSITIPKLQANEVCQLLDSEYNIMTRGGLQCAPLIHKSIGTYPNGTLRISLGYYNTKLEIDILISAIKQIIAKYVHTR
jgi:selenocysteine lyase/cysteine desulfurase